MIEQIEGTAPLARHHQIHSVQPLLPVADVAAAARWFCDTLGFETDLLWGDPVTHGRVRLGFERQWGDAVFIQLSRATPPIPTAVVLFLNVGHEIDGLYRRVLASGAEIAEPPIDRPWGLSEFVVRTPDGHELRLGAELDPPDDSAGV